MPEIIAITECLDPYLSGIQLRQMRQIVLVLLCMTGRVTMAGLSRWTANGGSLIGEGIAITNIFPQIKVA